MRDVKDHHLFVWEACLVPVDDGGKPLCPPLDPRTFTMSYDGDLPSPDPKDLQVQAEAFRRAVRLERREYKTSLDVDFDIESLRCVRRRFVKVEPVDSQAMSC